MTIDEREHMDRMTKEKRSEVMRAIRSKDTSIELKLRRALFARNVRYRVNRKCLGVSCDICILKYKIAVFCDGDFWHGNIVGRSPGTNGKFWSEKIRRNRERDLEQTILLRDNGWTVLRFWGSEIGKDAEACADAVVDAINKRKSRSRRKSETVMST